MSGDACREMPRYKCHKEVHAFKIKALTRFNDILFITPEEDGYSRFAVDEDYVNRHRPVVGGYYVIYSDGYKSFSPANAFENGYTSVA